MKGHIWPALILAAATAFSPIFAENDAAAANRPAKEIVLSLPKGEKKTFRLAVAPYVSEGLITLFPGDKIMVEFEIVDSAPKNPKVVSKMLHPERTLELEMKQDAGITFVERKSGFAQKLTMDCYFLTIGSDFKNHANMYPLEKGMGCGDGFEPKTYCIKFYDFGFER